MTDMPLTARKVAFAPVQVTSHSFRRSVEVRLKVSCGCKSQFGSIEDAEAHAVTTGHTLTISGEVRSI